jgi:hypothetical protein
MASKKQDSGKRPRSAKRANSADLSPAQVEPLKADQIRGGKVTSHDIHITQTVNKSSP